MTATATSSGAPNAAIGAMPMLFNEEAFPGAICDEKIGGCVAEVYQLPGTGNEDVPQDATQFNWTIFCTASGNPCNANSNGVKDIIDGGGEQFLQMRRAGRSHRLMERFEGDFEFSYGGDTLRLCADLLDRRLAQGIGRRPQID